MALCDKSCLINYHNQLKFNLVCQLNEFFNFHLQGHLIEAVAWNKTRLNDVTTQAILIGTSKGKVLVLVYITSISQPSTCIKISQAMTGLLAQQPCNNTVNMVEQDW